MTLNECIHEWISYSRSKIALTSKPNALSASLHVCLLSRTHCQDLYTIRTRSTRHSTPSYTSTCHAQTATHKSSRTCSLTTTTTATRTNSKIMAQAPPMNTTPTNRSPRSATGKRRKNTILFSMGLVLFVWPFYRASVVSTTIQDNKERDSFTAFNIDTTPKHRPCGQYKCFFRNKFNHNLGYLVAPETRKSGTDNYNWFETLEAGWNLAKSLKQQVGIQHLLMGPPEKVKVTKELAKQLNKNLYSEKSRRLIRRRKTTRYPKGTTAFVQKVTTAPKRNLVVGCTDSKVTIFKKNVDGFIKQIRYTETFVQNFKQGLQQAKQVISSEPCMTKDFQVIVDDKGNFFHLDFDR